jgi:hypothetical protein
MSGRFDSPNPRWAEIAEGLRVRTDEICNEIYADIQQRVPDPARDRNPEYQLGVRQTIVATLGYVLDGIAAEGQCDHPIPRAATQQARRAAQAGTHASLIMRRYLVAHARLGACVVEEANRCGFAADGLSPYSLQRAQEDMLQQLTACVEHEYFAERERLDAHPARHRTQIVRRLLHGEAATSEDLDVLGYKIESRWHVGLILSDLKATQGIVALQNIAATLLAVDGDDETTWVWLGWEVEPPSDTVRASLRAISSLHGSVGKPRRGIEGLRRTHAEALAAWPVVRRGCDKGLVECSRVTLEAALLGADVLGPLHQETYLEPLHTLRISTEDAKATLSAFLASGRNIASASARLAVQRSTVERRLQAISDALGRPVHSCLPELELALRLDRADVPPDPSAAI